MINDCIYVEGAVTIQARVESNLTSKGEFTVVNPWEKRLRVISDSMAPVSVRPIGIRRILRQ